MTSGATRPLLVVVEAGVLRDGRATAGIGRYVRSLTTALSRLDDVEVVMSVPTRPARSERHPLRYLHAQPRLLTTVLRHRPDIVHAVTSEPALGWPLGRQVVTVHDTIAWTSSAHRRRFPGRAYFRAQALRLRRCAAVIAVSSSVAADVVELLGVRADAVTVVPHGVDPVFRPVPAPDDRERRARLGVGADPYVFWSGSLLAHDPRKGLDTLVEAVARLRLRRPDVGLVLAGKTGLEATRIADLARANGVRLLLAGFVSDADLAALHRGAAASVLPSHHEGFGLPVLEALACGAPIIAGNAGNMPDLAGDAAVLVTPGDSAALSGALTAVISGDVGPRLRALGPTRAAGFTWERTARETVAVYRAAAEHRRTAWGRRGVQG